MKHILARVLLCLSFFLALPVSSEVGETNVIDAIATKPDKSEAILLLFQARPWNDESIALFNRKVEFYSLAISSGSLLEQKPGLQGKTFRIIVIHQHEPPNSVQERLRELKGAFNKSQVAFVWGKQKDLAALSTEP